MKTNTKTVLIIVATLLIGMLIGVLGSGFVVHRFVSRAVDMRRQDVFVERLMDVIDPAPDQEAEVKGILDRHAERFSDITDEFHRETSALFDSLRADLDPVLTDEQKARLEERHRRFGRLMGCGRPSPARKPGGKCPPPPPPPRGGGE